MPPVITYCWVSETEGGGEGKGGEGREQIKDKWTLLEQVRVAIALSILDAE